MCAAKSKPPEAPKMSEVDLVVVKPFLDEIAALAVERNALREENGRLREHINLLEQYDKLMKIPKNYVTEICKPGHGPETCGFLMMGGDWECAKGTSVEQAIQNRLNAGTMNAMGDNCIGPEDIKHYESTENTNGH